MSTQFRLANSLCCGRYQRTPPRFLSATCLPPSTGLRRSLGTRLVNRDGSLRAEQSKPASV